MDFGGEGGRRLGNSWGIAGGDAAKLLARKLESATKKPARKPDTVPATFSEACQCIANLSRNPPQPRYESAM